MLPESTLSDNAVRAAPLYAVRGVRDLLIDYELGGKGISDPSAGLAVKLWTLKGVKNKDTGVIDATLSAPDTVSSIILSSPTLTELALAFDQNMHTIVAYVDNGQSYLYWYDTTIPDYTTLTLPADVRNPRLCLDDHRQATLADSDVMLAYLRGGDLCYRQQRDRFSTEYVLRAVGSGAQLVNVAMNLAWRLQFTVSAYAGTVDGTVEQSVDPFLGDVVEDLCSRAGIPKAAVDVSELYDDTVPGYCLDKDEAASTYFTPLSEAFMFDPTEFDKQLHFFKRGRDVVAGVSYLDLISTDNDSEAMQVTLADKTKLPKDVNVSYTDPTGGYATNKQHASRKSNTIRTTAKKDIDTPLVLTPDQAAQFAEKSLKVAWRELMTQKFSLPLSFTRLVPADVIDYFAKDGSTQRIRLTSRNESDDAIAFEGKQDGGSEVYESSASGNPLPYPASTTPGLIGATRLEILNIPVLRDQDDELGVYVAVAGTDAADAWYGAQVLFSTDGETYAEAFRTSVPATLGDTTTELLEEISAEYPSDQSVTVTSNLPLSSVTRDALLNNANRCVIGDEVLQFQNATYLGNDQYRLSGLVRARYNTAPAHWPVGTRFVLLDEAIVFVQAQRYMLNMELWFKPVSFGTSDDDAVPTTYQFAVAESQREWAPLDVMAARDGSNNVTVSWTARPRLGIEIAPHESKYFNGYKISFSDGQAFTTPSVSYVRSAAPTGLTVSVCGTNIITGDGESTGDIQT